MPSGVPLFVSYTRNRIFLFLGHEAQSATCPYVCKEQRCLPTCWTCIALSGPLSLVPASTSRFRPATIDSHVLFLPPFAPLLFAFLLVFSLSRVDDRRACHFLPSRFSSRPVTEVSASVTCYQTVWSGSATFGVDVSRVFGRLLRRGYLFLFLFLFSSFFLNRLSVQEDVCIWDFDGSWK